MLVDVARTELFILYLLSVYFFAFVFSRNFQQRTRNSRSSTRIKFSELKKPKWAPPPWLFGVVWPILYTLQAISVYLIRLQGDWTLDENFWELLIFAILQIVLSVYTILFIRSLLWSTIVVYISWIFSIVTTVLFWPIDNVAGGLMIPLIVWLAYAAALSTSLLSLNRSRTRTKR